MNAYGSDGHIGKRSLVQSVQKKRINRRLDVGVEAAPGLAAASPAAAAGNGAPAESLAAEAAPGGQTSPTVVTAGKGEAPSAAPEVGSESHAAMVPAVEGVQMKGQLAAVAESADAVQAAAADGISGSGGAMPHGEAIQRSFGRHDISGVEAHTDENASTASAAMGAEAFATGNHVAFASDAPSLHTAAHEAAHVVQQKGGVQLSGGVGTEGDAYERHADAVADAVVAGESAEGLLDAGPNGAQPAESGSSPAVQLQAAPQTTTSISARMVGHASPRWERTHGKSRSELNLHLSRERVDAVRELFVSNLEAELLAIGVTPQFGVNVSAVDDDASIEVDDDARGDGDTTKEAGGDTKANASAMRRVNLDVTINKRTTGTAGASTTVSTTVPRSCSPDATRDWAVKLSLSGGAGHAGAGATGALGQLKNRLTGQEVNCRFVGGGAGVGLSTPGVDMFSDYTTFKTDAEYRFEDFNGVAARLTQAGAGIGIIGYSFTYLSFPTLGANSIDLGGANMGALGADASTNVGVWWLEDVPPQPCTPEHVITEDATEEHEYSYDEQQHFSHVVQFQTQSSSVSDLEAELLDSFVKTIVAAYD